MNTLWLHGMGGKPNEEKINYLKEQGLEMYALHMNYNEKPDRFEFLLNYCKEEEIKFLVGSSFGGFLAFWLSEELGIPCLLLNPAVSLRGKEKTKPHISQTISPRCLVAVGSEDDKIDYQRTLLFMEKDERPDKIIQSKVWQGEGHGFTMSAFGEIVAWALPEVLNFYRDKL